MHRRLSYTLTKSPWNLENLFPEPQKFIDSTLQKFPGFGISISSWYQKSPFNHPMVLQTNKNQRPLVVPRPPEPPDRAWIYGSKDSNFNSQRIFLCLKKYSILNAYLQIYMCICIYICIYIYIYVFMIVFLFLFGKNMRQCLSNLIRSTMWVCNLSQCSEHSYLWTFESPKAVGEQQKDSSKCV